MYLKLMSDDHAADSDSRKRFILHDGVISVEFDRDGEGGAAVAHVVFERGEPETFTLEGNAYVMNESGKTIASFGPMDLVPDPLAHDGPPVPPNVRYAVGKPKTR